MDGVGVMREKMLRQSVAASWESTMERGGKSSQLSSSCISCSPAKNEAHKSHCSMVILVRERVQDCVDALLIEYPAAKLTRKQPLRSGVWSSRQVK